MDHDAALVEAARMLDAFASVGADRFALTFTDLDGNKREFRPTQSLARLLPAIPHLMQRAQDRRWNLIVRPYGGNLIQLDDLDIEKIARVRDMARNSFGR